MAKTKALILWRGLSCNCEATAQLNPEFHLEDCAWKKRWDAEKADPTLIPGNSRGYLTEPLSQENAETRNRLGFVKTWTQ